MPVYTHAEAGKRFLPVGIVVVGGVSPVGLHHRSSGAKLRSKIEGFPITEFPMRHGTT